MRARNNARKVITVTIACMTAAATGFTLGYLLVPAYAEAAGTNTTGNVAGTASPEARTGLPAQAGSGAPRMISPASIDQSVIGGNVMMRASGAMGVNQAAGDMNQQANAAAVVYNPQGQGVASSQTAILQGAGNIRGSLPDQARTRIDGQAFANTSGVLAVNQASGVANSQANSTTIAVGVNAEGISDSVLAETLPNATGLVKTGNDKASVRDVSVSETAFQNTHGVVQLNQTAGVCNNSANNFALHLSLEPKQ